MCTCSRVDAGGGYLALIPSRGMSARRMKLSGAGFSVGTRQQSATRSGLARRVPFVIIDGGVFMRFMVTSGQTLI